jgi:hypothetical protein
VYLAEPARVSNLGEGEILYYATRTGRRELIEPAEHLLLQALQTPAARDDIDARVAEASGPQFPLSELDAMLRSLCDRGLLQSDLEPADLLDGKNESRTRPRLSVSWITRGRASALERSLRSFHALGRATDAVWRVFHDRTDPKAESVSRNRVQSVASELGQSISFFGSSERARFHQELVHALSGRVSAELINFALYGGLPHLAEAPDMISTGAMRNWALLYSADELSVSCDDDVLLPYRRLRADVTSRRESAGERSVLSAEQNPLSTMFCEDWNEVHSDTEEGSEGLEDVIAPLIGRAEGKPPVFGPFRSQDLPPAGRFRVALACPGVAGDFGMSRGYSRLLLAGEERSRVIADDSRFERIRRTRLAVSHANELTLSTGRHFMTTHVAMDRRLDLVPFPPLGRGQDAVFRSVLAATQPYLIACHLPFAVQHVPGEARVLPENASLDVAPRFSELLLALMAGLEASSMSTGAGPAFARHLQSISARAPLDFEQQLRYRWAQAASAHILRCEGLLNYYGHEPVYWADALSEHIDAVRSQLLSGEITPVDVGGFSPPDALEFLRAFLDHYAELIAEWPTICRAAAELLDGGRSA